MRYTLLAGASALALGFASSSAMAAGDIVLTGHDNDFHYNFGAGPGNSGEAGMALAAEIAFARQGSGLPVLSIDAGTELTNALTGLSIPFTNVTPGAVTGGMFNHSVYSAFVVASVTSCDGCDNPPGTGLALAAFNTQIAAFFTAGGGIVGLAGASDPNAYAYVPESGGTTTPIFSSSGFVATPTGLAGIPGFTAVNGDQTHNTFSGFSSFYHVAEVFNPAGGTTGPAVTIFGRGVETCTGTHCHIHGVPEPSTWVMMGLGFGAFGLMAARRRRGAASAIA
jgi:hypothetical protein